MMKLLERASNNVSISNFYEEYSIGKYNMSPPYQRLSVWSPEKKSFFIDSILKNLPIPPVFLRQKIDDITGKTSYDVIDGKQRLTSIIEFIENSFPTADEGEDPFHDEELAGKLFSELENDRLTQYKKMFWRYQIPVEYIDSDDPIVIDRIFDRLNRNGEPLNGQELRHSNYYNTQLLKTAYNLSENTFWKARLKTTDKSRMEDIEFISELIFTILEGGESTATNEELDKYYQKYSANDDIDWQQIFEKFTEITKYMESLNLDYEDYKIYGVSHLYGIWCFCVTCVSLNISLDKVKPKILEFFSLFRNKNYELPMIQEYKQSMSNRTKFKGQRTRRKNALLTFCEVSCE